MARGEGGGAAAEGRGRRLAKPGGRRTSRLLRARATNGGCIPFVPGLVSRQARSLRTRACARGPRRHPSLSPFVAETAAVATGAAAGGAEPGQEESS